MRRALSLLVATFLLPASASAHLGGLEMAVPLWSVAFGFIVGLLSLAVPARKRWPFVLVPVLTATMFLVWKLPGSDTSTSLIELLGYTLVFGGILLLQFLAGFGIAILGEMSVRSLSAAWSKTVGAGSGARAESVKKNSSQREAE